MFKQIPLEIKQEILQKVKEGLSASDVAIQYGISTKTVYKWLQNETCSPISILISQQTKEGE